MKVIILSLLSFLSLHTSSHAQTVPTPATVPVSAGAGNTPSVVLPLTAPVTLKAGTLVVLETTAVLTSKEATQGQTIPLRVKYAVLVDGQTVIAAGAPAGGQVTAAAHHKGLGKEGSLAIKPSVVQAVDGQMIPLVGQSTASAGNGTAGAAIGLAVVVSPLFLLHKGKEATIPAGYELPGTVANETLLK